MTETNTAGTPSRIVFDIQAHAGFVTIENPARHNAMTLAMWRALAETFAALDARDDVAAIVIRGGGRDAFSAGADISEFDQVRHDTTAIAAYDAAIAAAELAIGTSRVPTIAMLHGVCAGGGAAIAVACDLRFASDDLRFSIPAAKIGAVYPSSTIARLVRIIGGSAAFDVIASGRELGAAEALRLRLVDRSVPVQDLDRLLTDYVARLRQSAPLSIRAALLAVRSAGDPGNDVLKARLRDAEREAFGSDDYREGISAFLEKRPARFGKRR